MRRFILGSSAVLLSVVLVACGGDDEPATTSSGDRSPASSTAATDEATGDASATPESTVAPTTGQQITAPGITLNAPTDWTGDISSTSTGGGLVGPDIGADYLSLDVINSAVNPGDTVDDLAEIKLQTTSITPKPTRQPDITIAGQPAYYLSGEDTGFVRWTETYGFALDGGLVEITIGSPLDEPQAERDAMSAAVLASVRLTG